ncbi:unnamed protein product [Orchesella dallaii]|uniref:BTB domain-containing protein n=1 Tax=Orchesella dallaii TaxID=48710 RepID=A0ABP1RGF6_9HEXA
MWIVDIVKLGIAIVQVELPKMEAQKQQVFLIENRSGNPNWGPWPSNPDPFISGNVTLYDSKKDELKFSSTSSDSYSENQSTLTLIQQILNAAGNQNTITMLSSYHRNTETFKTSLQVVFEESVLQSLHEIWKNFTVKVKFNPGLEITFEIPIQDRTIPGADGPQQVFTRQQYPGTNFDSFTYSVILQFQKYANKISRFPVLRHLFVEKTLADCCILTAEKTKIKCHASILAANSDVFHTMLTSGFQESQTNTIEMTDLSETVVNTLLSYLYGLEIDTLEIEADMAFDLLQVAHKYNLADLEKDMLETLLIKPDDSSSVNTVLAMYFFTEKIEDFKNLCDKYLRILRKNPDELQLSSAYQELIVTDAKAAVNLAFKLLALGSS